MKDNKAYHVVYNDCPGEFCLSRSALEWLASRGVVKADLLLRETESCPWTLIDESMVGLFRHNSLLALCVKELGSESASGDHSLLRVRPIESKRYMIRNVGGIETVLTPEEIIWVEID